MLMICIFSLFLLKCTYAFDFYVLTPIEKYKFHSRGPNTQENVTYVLDFYVSADDLFSNFD